MNRYLTLSNIFLFISSIAFSQTTDTTAADVQTDTSGAITEIDSVYQELLFIFENSDIDFLWGGDLSQDNRIGFIGDEFQRFQIRFLSVIQNFDNPYEYFLYGKSRVHENICEFQGSLQIIEVSIIEDDNFPGFTRVFLGGNYVLFEDQTCLHSGIFRGEFNSFVYLDEEGTIFYDNLEKEKDDYANNQFFGDWEGYFSEEIKTCNWGDYRIPFSSGLDMGPDEFKPSFRYLENGWREYLREKEMLDKGEEVEVWWE